MAAKIEQLKLLNERVNTLLANEQDEHALNLTDNLTFTFKRPEDLLSYPILARLLMPASLHKILKGRGDSVHSIACSPDNKLIASASLDNTVRLWDIPSGDLNAELEGLSSHVYSVAFSPNGQSIVTGSFDWTVRTWSIATKQQVQILHGHSNAVRSVAWSPNGDVIASGSCDSTVILWDAISGSVKKKLTGHKHFVKSVSFSQNGNKLVSAGYYDYTAIIWDIRSGAALIKLTHSDAVLSVCFSHDDQFVVTGCADYAVHMFNANYGHEVKRFEGHFLPVSSVACSFDGSMIASSCGDGIYVAGENSIRLWDVASGKQLQQLNGHTHWVRSVAFSRDGKFIVSGSADGTVRLWNVPPSLPRQISPEMNNSETETQQEQVAAALSSHPLIRWVQKHKYDLLFLIFLSVVPITISVARERIYKS